MICEQLKWDEVERAAREVFHVWGDSSCELDWAHHAWSHLEHANLTLYEEDDEVDRCRVAARFISLCNLYYDFIHLAWEETGYVLPYGELAEKLRLEAPDVVALARSYEDWEEDDPEVEPEYLLGDALKFLSDEAHGAVVTALREGFDGDQGLLTALWRSDPEHHYEVCLDSIPDHVPLDRVFISATTMVLHDWAMEQNFDNLRSVRDGHD